MSEKGSKIFGDTVPFKKKHADELKAKMDKYLAKLGLQSVLVGSTSDPDKDPEELASDLDTMVDLDDIIRALKVQPNPADKKDTVEKAARRALSAAVQGLGLQTSQTGVNVFVRLPFGPNAHQVDLECIRKVGKVSRYHQHRIPRGSPYKGVSKQLVIAVLAKQQGYMYAAWEGLFRRNAEGKKGELVADDWDEMAKVLLGPKADGNNLGSVEAIMKSLPHDQAQALLAHVKQDKNWVEKPSQQAVAEDKLAWFKDISLKLSL
jgi:hypothetical protein